MVISVTKYFELYFVFKTVTILNIKNTLAFYIKHDVSETGFCLRLQVEVRRQRLALSIGSNWVGSTWRRRQNEVSETSYLK
jgi:hypothetical protein